MEHLFRDRMDYIKSERPAGCFICDGSELVLGRSSRALSVLNRYPYNNGHILVAPARHVPDLVDLDAEESAEIWQMINTVLTVLRSAMKPEGFNIGANLGAVAGAGLPGHVHVHVVPRWSGDTNFMPVLGDTKVVPESLEATYTNLKQFF